MYKVARHRQLALVGMAGIDPGSDGLARARHLGFPTTDKGLAGLLSLAPDVDLVFDATSAQAHLANMRLLAGTPITCVNMTPAITGPKVVPTVNLADHLGSAAVNLITCGAQATVPIVAAISSATTVTYAEIVSTVASRSAGPGTRQNIDEFTVATAQALCEIGGAAAGKAIVILNPAVPPILMRNTVYARSTSFDANEVLRSIAAMVVRVQAYVPGYRLKVPPIVEDGLITVFLEVEGAGDYLPPYAGNLDIMTAAGIRVAELILERRTPMAASA
jgi:acetaldehyde dehydrogenase